jgi:hypothetical protein
VAQVAAAQPNYVIVLINGGALGTDWIAKNSPAVIEAFYPVRYAFRDIRSKNLPKSGAV